MKKLEQTWRWYGPEDPVSLIDAKQAGATGIVSALHHIPHGEIWPAEEILERKKTIEEAGLTWSVVESVPVHEHIKTKSGNYKQYLDNYVQTLSNLADCGLKIVCYNFMPILDWTRTQIDLTLADGSKALHFDWIDLAIFDIYILKRINAESEYSQEILNKVEERYVQRTPDHLQTLLETILMGIPGEGDLSIEDLKNNIKLYNDLGQNKLRDNLYYFLNNIQSICEEKGLFMTIHPDDPPFPILGIPRIVNSLDDYKSLFSNIPSHFNGVCFCTGSLGASGTNNLNEIFNLVKDRTYFVHLRNVKKDKLGSFYEADHLGGDVNMYEIMKALIEENQHRDRPIPFRPDHGHQMLDDLNKTTNPGYSAIGRLRGLAELRGLEYGIIGA